MNSRQKPAAKRVLEQLIEDSLARPAHIFNEGSPQRRPGYAVMSLHPYQREILQQLKSSDIVSANTWILWPRNK